MFKEVKAHHLWYFCVICVGCFSESMGIVPKRLDFRFHAGEFIRVFALLGTNIAPENRPSQKESNLPAIHFQVLR